VLFRSLYADGDGVAKDPARAVGLFQQACDAGSARGCLELGEAREAADDLAAAARAYESSCTLG
jgi:TPR repeat protein